MTGFALSLVLTAAFTHASWNFLAKRAGGGAAFLWLFASLSVLIYAPLALTVALWQRPQLGWVEVVFFVASGAIHLGYFLLLQQGYRVGDLSLVYPLARGTGPMLSTAAAIAFFNERPTAIALSGTLLIACGIVLLTAQGGSAPRQDSVAVERGRSIVYALLTGAFIAAYTLLDKVAVSQLQIPPLLYDWGANLSRTVMLTPLVWRQFPEVKRLWQVQRWEAIGVACLSPLAYILVLTALVFSPVSYVAPAREISIVIGAAMGTQLLSEGQGLRRLLASSLMVLGVFALAIG